MEVQLEEIESLQREFEWVLTTEVKSVLKQLKAAVKECANKFPIAVGPIGAENLPVVEKFILTAPSTSPSDQLKVIISVTGDSITQADINLKLPRPHGKDAYHNTTVREDVPWRLQQVQDAANHLHIAVDALESLDDDHQFQSAAEVVHFLNTIMSALQRGRTALVVPKKRTLEDLMNSKNVKSLVPPLPREVAVSFYLQSWKLIFAVYHMVVDKGVSRFDRYQAECVVPWINDVLLMFTVALQTGQQLKDKLTIFQQYSHEISLKSNPAAAGS